MKRFIAILVMALLLAGCSTCPVSTEYKRQAIVETKQVEQPSRKVSVRITRTGNKLTVSKEAKHE